VAPLDAGHRVELPDVPVGIVQRADLPGVVEERVRVPRLRVEAELVGDVVAAVAVVVDVQLVESVLVEIREVRPSGRLLEGDVVGDDRDAVRPVRADERVHICVVSRRIGGDQWRLAVARRLGRLRPDHEQERDDGAGERQRGELEPLT
jgi:hypothetical protein